MTSNINSITDITAKVLKFRNERDWQQFHSISQMILAMYREVSELAEHFQWLSQEECVRYAKNNKTALADELADVLYWTILISADLGIDLKSAVASKMKKNAKKYPVKLAYGNKTKYTKLVKRKRVQK